MVKNGRDGGYNHDDLKNRLSGTAFNIGVTGHRKIENSKLCADRVRTILEEVAEKHKNPAAPPLFTILSPLAEGADRLVAEEILKWPRASLHAVLPLSVEDYLSDFQTESSKRIFNNLLKKAENITQIRTQPTRKDAYLSTGHYIVDHCDFLIAIWDGKQGQSKGGTADIVQYARSKICPIFWIESSGSGMIHKENNPFGLANRLA
jgi:hypothetical protein